MSAAAAGAPAPELELSAAEARRMAVVASFGNAPHPDSASVLRHLGLLQLDPLARVEKAHRLTCLTRMGPDASVDDIDAPLWATGQATAFETWVHAVCLVPIEDWPLLRLTRERVRSSPKRPPEAVLDEVRSLVAESPAGVTISEIEQPGARAQGWSWSERKHATEYMVRSGELICSARRGTKRVFDLPERRVLSDLLKVRMEREDILGALVTKALAALGVATVSDICTYYSLAPDDARTGVDVAAAMPVRVEGWTVPAWALPSSQVGLPSVPGTDVLVGPFDNLIWDRPRVRRVFDFDYVFEAYKPAASRTYGHYVLALLAGDRLTGRADVRREARQLSVLASYPEPSTDTQDFAASLDVASRTLEGQIRRPAAHS